MAVDPDRITTVEELTVQLRTLFEESGKSYERFAADAGLGTATLHELVNKTDSFPRRDTVQEFVRACGQDPASWTRAWMRVDQARAKPARASVHDLRKAADDLRRELEQSRQQLFTAEVAREAARQVAEQQIGDLTAELAKVQERLEEAQHELQHLRDARAAAAVLTGIGHPSFRPAPTDAHRGGQGYDSTAVTAFMQNLRAAAAEGLAETAHLLAFHTLPHQSRPFTGGSSALYNAGFLTEDVDAYLTAVRKAINEVL
ncbi:helix-turn-helix domain-containing protein [Streptomyces sp. NPDC001177]